MNDSFNILIKLILPESIEDYFELTNAKKGRRCYSSLHERTQ
jgi:hypothetical protein